MCPDGHYRMEAKPAGICEKSSEDVQLARRSGQADCGGAPRVATLAELNAPAAGVTRLAQLRQGRPTPEWRWAWAGPRPGWWRQRTKWQWARRRRRSRAGWRRLRRSGTRRRPRRICGGRGQQLPPGVANAINQGMAGGGFAQTDLNGGDGGGAPRRVRKPSAKPPAARNVQANGRAEFRGRTAVASSRMRSCCKGPRLGQGLAANNRAGNGRAWTGGSRWIERARRIWRSRRSLVAGGGSSRLRPVKFQGGPSGFAGRAWGLWDSADLLSGLRGGFGGPGGGRHGGKAVRFAGGGGGVWRAAVEALAGGRRRGEVAEAGAWAAKRSIACDSASMSATPIRRSTRDRIRSPGTSFRKFRITTNASAATWAAR